MTFTALILATAKTVGVPASLFLAICTHESNLHNIVVPHDGGSASYGLCQIKEDTAKDLGYRGIATGPVQPSYTMPGALEPAGKPKGLMVPSVNVLYAAKYLKKKLEQYDNDWCKATAAYNAGTYNPSTKLPGKPRNFKYIKKVVLHLDNEHKDYLVCGARKVEE